LAPYCKLGLRFRDASYKPSATLSIIGRSGGVSSNQGALDAAVPQEEQNLAPFAIAVLHLEHMTDAAPNCRPQLPQNRLSG